MPCMLCFNFFSEARALSGGVHTNSLQVTLMMELFYWKLTILEVEKGLMRLSWNHSCRPLYERGGFVRAKIVF